MQHAGGFRGYGINTSPHARHFTAKHVAGWGFGDAYTPRT
jgi:hypothetical protein